MIGSVSFVVRACVILSVCVGPAIMGPAPTTSALNASVVASSSAAAAALPSLNGTATVVLPNPYAGLPTKFGDEDDVIRAKHTRPATAAVIQQQRPASVAAARKSQFDAIGSADASKEASRHGSNDDAYYDEDEDDDDGANEDDDEHGGGPRSSDDFDGGHKTHTGDTADYADETDSELGPTLDNFGASLDGTADEALPILLVEPQSAYIVRGRPAVLTCKAANALQLSFKCSGSAVPPPSTLESHVNPHTGVHLLEVTATITKDMVYEFFGKEAFRCRCHAWSPRAKAKSQPATIEIACKFGIVCDVRARHAVNSFFVW